MNIYGDWGNVLVLKRRLEWHGYAPQLVEYNVGDEFPENVDVIIGGGGQDSGQSVIQQDLLSIGPKLRQLAENGVPMLVICGLYQLFGHRFVTHEGDEIRGIGLLDIKAIFGETAVRRKMRLKLIVHLVRKETMEREFERLPYEPLTQDVLGVPVLKVVIQVVAGRNIAVLVEAAVRNTILQLRGIDTYQEFVDRHRRAMERDSGG
jgi:hypothetical protein